MNFKAILLCCLLGVLMLQGVNTKVTRRTIQRNFTHIKNGVLNFLLIANIIFLMLDIIQPVKTI